MELEKMFIAPRRRLAKVMGISPTAVWKRLQKLQKQKEIIGYYSNGRASLYVKKGE
jgi:DNA-binding Lrp family transcriptional regulator